MIPLVLDAQAGCQGPMPASRPGLGLGASGGVAAPPFPLLCVSSPFFRLLAIPKGIGRNWPKIARPRLIWGEAGRFSGRWRGQVDLSAMNNLLDVHPEFLPWAGFPSAKHNPFRVSRLARGLQIVGSDGK